jgi:hypothetical protein
MISIGLKKLKEEYKGFSYETHISDVMNTIIGERIILYEDENNKIINNELNIDKHLVPFIESLTKTLFSDSNDIQFENELKRVFLVFFGNLYEELCNSYNSGKRGAIQFLKCNMSYIITSVVGSHTVDELKVINEFFLDKFIDLLIECYYNERNNDRKETISTNNVKYYNHR